MWLIEVCVHTAQYGAHRGVCTHCMCLRVTLCVVVKADQQTLPTEQTKSGKGKCPYDPSQRTATAMIGKGRVCVRACVCEGPDGHPTFFLGCGDWTG